MGFFEPGGERNFCKRCQNAYQLTYAKRLCD